MAPFGQKPLVSGNEKPASVLISDKVEDSTSMDLETPTPEESEWLKSHGVDLPKVSADSADPRLHSDYVDNLLNAVGFGIYLGGYYLFLDGFEMPVFVPHSHFNFNASGINAVDLAIYPDYYQAVDHLPVGPPAPGLPFPNAYYRGAGGKVIAPTLFTQGTTPRVIQTALEATRLLGKTVSDQLTIIGLQIVGAMLLRGIVGIITRISSGEGTLSLSPAAKTARGLVKDIGAKGKPVIANMGGAGAAHEPQLAININNQAVARKNIPYHVEADASDIGLLFDKETLDQVVGHHMAPGTINWNRAIPGIKNTLKSGGTFRFDWRGSTKEAAEVVRMLQEAGFKDIKNFSDALVTAVKG
jgi:hypothetical protein